MSERLNTQDLIDLLIHRQGLERKEAESFIKEFFSLIEEGLEKDKTVKIKGLGTFKLVYVDSRESINVNTGERIEIQGHTKISFTPDSALRNVINKPFAHFETVVLNDGIEFNDTVQEDNQESLDDTEPEASEEKTETEVLVEKVEISPNPKVEEIKVEKSVEIAIKNTPTIDEIIAAEKLASTAFLSEKKNEEGANNKILTIVVVLTILLCGSLLFFTYYSDIFPEEKGQPALVAPLVLETDPIILDPTEELILEVEDVIDQLEIPDDSKVLKIEIEEAIPEPIITKPEPVVTKPVTSNVQKDNNVPFSQRPVKADSTSYEITGTKTTHTIKEGETLIRISYHYYGTKDLWPYLVMHNLSVIKNPNNVPLGTTINVPELKKK